MLASSLLVDPGRTGCWPTPATLATGTSCACGGRGSAGAGGPETRYQLTPHLVERHWDAQSVRRPGGLAGQPHGTLLHRDELAARPTASGMGGHLVVDEIYHGLTYGVDATSVLEVDDDAFVLNSFSKYFGMTVWRLGWLVAPREAVRAGKAGAEPLHQRALDGPARRAGLFPRGYPGDPGGASRRVRPPP